MNDWIIANINNPDFEVSDFRNVADMTINNTQMLTADEYMKSDFIRFNPVFQDSNGKFSKDKFQKFYNEKLIQFQEFYTESPEYIIELDAFDTDITPESRIRKDGFSIKKELNPDRQKIGIEGINVISAPEYSKSELAQMNKIWDSEAQRYKSYSPDDISLTNNLFGFLNNLFSDPLVLAQWEEDGTHIDPVTGQLRSHVKGDYKLNDKGTYYYETLNGRSPIGKQVLSVLDNLTPEDSKINDYDFFDSDDLQKSVPGVIFKNVATLIPIFIGGPIGRLYSATLVGREFVKSAPMLYDIVGMLSGTSSESPAWLNSVAALGEKFSGGTSQYAKEHVFSFENFGNLISDVALQWEQMTSISNAVNKLRGSKNYIDDATKQAHALYNSKKSLMGAQAAINDADWKNSPLGRACLQKFIPEAQKATKAATQLGRDISMAYMAVTSNSSVYNDMILAGATRTEAAAVALGSTLGMFALNKYTNLGELFFDDATENSVKAARYAIKKEIQEASGAFAAIKNSNASSTKKLLGFINIASDKGKKVMSKFTEDLQYHTTNLIGKAVGEGIEEVTEELISDLSKSMYELAGKFGYNTAVKDVGAWDNMFERYTMSLFGGMIGGSIFYGKQALQGEYKKNPHDEELVTLIRNGYVGDLRNVLNDLKSKGKLGSTTLSAVDYQYDDQGNPVWITTSNRNNSQNDFIARLINDKITAIETVINNNQVNLSDEDLFKQMVLSDARYYRYRDIAGMTNYYQDFNNVLSDLIKAEIDYKTASGTLEGVPNGTPLSDSDLRSLTPEQQVSRTEHLNLLKGKLDEARDKKNKFLSGDTSLDYTRKLNFAIDPLLHNNYLAIDELQLWKQHYGDKPMFEDPAEYAKFVTTVLEPYRKEALKNNLTISWERHKQVEQVLLPFLQELADNTPQFKTWVEQFDELQKTGFLNKDNLKKSYLNYDSKLDDESDDDYKLRNTKIVTTLDDSSVQTESEEEFKFRILQRINKIKALNDAKDKEWTDNVIQKLQEIGGNLDPISARAIMKIMPRRAKDIINRKISESNLSAKKQEILTRLNSDLSNVDEILTALKQFDEYKDPFKSFVESIRTVVDEDGDPIDLVNLFDEQSDEYGDATIGDILDDPDTWLIWDEGSNINFTNQLNKLVKFLSDSGVTNIKDIKLKDIFDDITDDNSSNVNLELENAYEKLRSFDENQINQLIQDLRNNSVIQLKNSIKQVIKNPVIELIKGLANKIIDKIEVPKIEELLNTIENNYDNIDTVSSLELDSEQLKILYTTKDIIKLIRSFVYAASSTAELNKPIGHNKVINEFAKNHKDLVENWEELPEIDSDYATIYIQQLYKYESELNAWIDLSNKNSINKREQFVKTDKAFTKSLYDLIQDRENAKAFRINIDDEEYNLLEGLDASDPDINVNLFNYERILYINFQKALSKSKLSIQEFLEKSKLFDKLVNFDLVKNQNVSKLNPELTYKKLSNYDKLLYFANIFTYDPIDFYIQLKSNITKNEDTAPITTQEYAARIANASQNQQFKDIIRYAHEKSNDDKVGLFNTTITFGAAGAGKTQVVAKYSKDLQNPDVEILVAGPTENQAKTLQRSLNTKNYITIEKFLKQILGDTQYESLNKAIKESDWDTNKNVLSENDFFTAFENNIGIINFKLDKSKIKFNILENSPKLLIIDEATHIPSVMAQVLDEYMQQTGGHLLLLGDNKQRGYHNSNSGMGNIRELDLFAIRTPELTISLRDNNIQKQSNLEIVKNLLDQIHDNKIKLSEEELKQYYSIVENLISKLNFKVHNQIELAGDLITQVLSEDVVNKLKSEKKTVGFIGDSVNSVTYKTLQQAGLITQDNVMNLDSMQGQEFDYIVIDHKFEKPTGDKIEKFLQDLYTLMSRGKSAAIFIDNGLSEIIGNNIVQNYTTLAPNLNEKIDGVSAVDELRKFKLDIINKFDLTKTDVKTDTPTPPKPTDNPYYYFVNPDDNKNDDDVKKIIHELENLDENESDVVEHIDNIVSEFSVNAYSETTYLGVQAKEDTQISNVDNKEYTYDRWEIKHPKKEEHLRNLQALLPNNSSAFWYTEKQEMQNLLFKFKSMLLFDHSLNETRVGSTQFVIPKEIRDNFTDDLINKGTYEIEIRDASGEVRPLQSPFNKNGFDWNNETYSVNIVFKVKNKEGRDCIFDIAGMNDPATLKSKLNEIKSNLKERIANGKTDEKVKTKLQNVLSTIDASADNYEILMDSWIKEFKTKGEFSLNISNAIFKTKTTWFKKRTGRNIRLGGKINPNTLEKDVLNLKALNPSMVFSDVYTFADQNNDFSEVDTSVKGKAVVFVTSDTLLRPDELLTIYNNQKKNPNDNTPVVRMLVLDNYGLTMSQMLDSDFTSEFSQGEEEHLPLTQNYVGIQMFTSMWNFRAALEQFNDVLAVWKNDNDYTTEFVDKLLEIQHYIYSNNLSGPQLETYLKSRNVSIDDIKNLTNFNQEICKNIPTFRLGFSEKNGFHVEQYNTKNSSAYNSSNANLLVINQQKLEQFRVLIDGVMKGITFDNELSLQVKLLKEDNTEWSPKELIDLTNAKHKRSLSQLLKLDDGQISIVYDGKKIAYPKGQNWSYIPRLVSSILRTTTFYQYNPNEISSDGMNFAHVKIYTGTNDKGEKEYSVLRTQIGQWLTPNSNGETILKTIDEPAASRLTEGKKYIKKENYLAHPDRSLADMFDLIFHGTTDDIHKLDPRIERDENGKLKTVKPNKSTQLLQLTDARFKQGFFIHPSLDRGQDGTVESFNSPGTDKAIFLKLQQQEEFYTCDVDLRSSGISINFNKLYELYRNRGKQSEPVVISDPITNVTEELSEIEQIFNTKYKNAYNIWKNNIVFQRNYDLDDYDPREIDDIVTDIKNKLIDEMNLSLHNINSESELKEALNNLQYYEISENGDLIETPLIRYFQTLTKDETLTDDLISYNNGIKIKGQSLETLISGTNEEVIEEVEPQKPVTLNDITLEVSNIIADIINEGKESKEILDLYNDLNGTEITEFDEFDDIDNIINLFEEFDFEILNPIMNSPLGQIIKEAIIDGNFNNVPIENKSQFIEYRDKYEKVIQILKENHPDIINNLENVC